MMAMVNVSYADEYYTGPIELIDGLLDVTKKAVLAQIEWTESFQVMWAYFSFCLPCCHFIPSSYQSGPKFTDIVLRFILGYVIKSF